MEAAPISLSVIVPAYDESRRIGGSLREVSAYLALQPYTSEIVVVDDGSDDGTCDVVRELAPRLPVPLRLLSYRDNRGKGGALKAGFEAARGDTLLFADADLSTPIEETRRLLDTLDSGYDFVIGSRKMPGAEIVVHQHPLREWMGRVFTALVSWLIADVSDVTCGFKLYRGDVGRDLFGRLRIFDWSFDAELLHIAGERGYRFAEVPVRWQDREGTKVKLGRDVARSLLGIARIRLHAARGRYRDLFPAEPAQEIQLAAPDGDRGEESEPAAGPLLGSRPHGAKKGEPGAS